MNNVNKIRCLKSYNKGWKSYIGYKLRVEEGWKVIMIKIL